MSVLVLVAFPFRALSLATCALVVADDTTFTFAFALRGVIFLRTLALLVVDDIAFTFSALALAKPFAPSRLEASKTLSFALTLTFTLVWDPTLALTLSV